MCGTSGRIRPIRGEKTNLEYGKPADAIRSERGRWTPGVHGDVRQNSVPPRNLRTRLSVPRVLGAAGLVASESPARLDPNAKRPPLSKISRAQSPGLVRHRNSIVARLRCPHCRIIVENRPQRSVATAAPLQSQVSQKPVRGFDFVWTCIHQLASARLAFAAASRSHTLSREKNTTLSQCALIVEASRVVILNRNTSGNIHTNDTAHPPSSHRRRPSRSD